MISICLHAARAAGLAQRQVAAAAAGPAWPGAFQARGLASGPPSGTEPGTEGSTGRHPYAQKPADEAPEGAPIPPDNPSVDSIRHGPDAGAGGPHSSWAHAGLVMPVAAPAPQMMGKVNQAAGGDYDFSETGGTTIRDMASEIASNATAPLERAADSVGGGVMGAVNKIAGAAKGAAGKVSDVAGKATSGAKHAAHDAGARAADMGSRAVEGGGAGTHTLGEQLTVEDGEGGRGGGGDGQGGGARGMGAEAVWEGITRQAGPGEGGKDGRSATP